MRIAKWARENIPTHYYISPQIWAWKKIASLTSKDVDKMYVILPFEKTFYEDKHNFPVEFVGHPLIDAIHNHQ
jgi:lipid-A-disaccharide synthase